MDNVLIKLNETDRRTIDRASNLTITSYTDNGIVSVDTLLTIIEDLINEISDLNEQASNLEEQMKEEPIKDYYDYYGVSRNDF